MSQHRARNRFFGIAAALVVVSAAWAGVQAKAASERAAAEAEVRSFVHGMYEVISGDAGEARDWDRFRAMFADDGKLSLFAPGRPPNGEGEGAVPARRIVWSPDDYIQRAGAHMEANAFYELEIHSEVRVFGRMAHVYSSYEAFRDPEGEPIARGINSIQLVRDPGVDEWKVLLIIWDSETPELPLPAEMDHGGEASGES